MGPASAGADGLWRLDRGCSALAVPAASFLRTAARIVDAEPISARQVDLTIDSPAVGSVVKVRLLLPKGFERGPTPTREPAATVHLYEPGTHNWIYWERELHAAWPMITRALGV